MDMDNDDFGSLRQENMDVGYKTSNDLDLNVDQDCRSQSIDYDNGTHSTFSSKDEVGADSILQVGMEFESDEQAYKFYIKYARTVGFNVRKDWVNRSKVHGQVVSRKFTCSREGYRRRDKRDINVKKHRKETRTGCLAHMIITRQPDGRYGVAHFEERHNHDNVSPDNPQTLCLQRELSVDKYAEVDLGEELGPQPKLAFEAMTSKFRVRSSLDDFAAEFGNYLQTERIRDMKEGEAARLVHYFQRQHFENPSFFYALHLDVDDKVSSIFWSDDNMVSDYGHFGDVICLDTICRTMKDHFPFVQFVGLNHHKQVVIFAAALLYDDTVESLKWLFRTFLEAMSGRKPKAIHTDQDAAIIEAVCSVLPETKRCICVWQMYENAVKHLSNAVKDTQSFASDFKSCIYDTKDEEGFTRAWDDLLNKYGLQQNEWLKWMFRERERWAVVYGRNAFFVDTMGSHLGEILSNDLRSYLNSGLDVLQFFRHFEMVAEEQRYKEIEASDEMNRCVPRLMANAVMLKHASEIYTPRAFETFQRGYERSLNVVVNQCGENGSLFEYKANKFGQTREYNLTFNSSDDSVLCSCKKFECVGFLCCHALKVLDHRNIKMVPSKYVMKRWTKDARLGSVTECNKFSVKENRRMIVAWRYKDLCRRILALSARASESDEAFLFASRQLDEVVEGVEKVLRLKPDEAQAVTSSIMGANASESDHAEFFLNGNAIEEQAEHGTTLGDSRAIMDQGHMTNLDRNGSSTTGIQNVETIPLSKITCGSSSSPIYISPQATTGNPIVQGLYSFEANQVIKCMYHQPNLVIDHQTNPNMYQPSNFYTNQHDSASQSHSQLLQEPLIHNAYPASISNTPQLSHEMDLDIQNPRSTSVLPIDQRYRVPYGHK